MDNDRVPTAIPTALTVAGITFDVSSTKAQLIRRAPALIVAGVILTAGQAVALALEQVVR
jgi:hypothetical protein